MDKADSRRRFRAARKALSPSERKRAQREMVRRLKPLLGRGKRIGLYWPVGSEADVRGLLQTASQRRAEVYFPYIEKGRRRLWFTRYCGQPAARGGWAGIAQFKGGKIRARYLNILILPLLAADGRGVRLGQGGGFYDATLARCGGRRPLKIGIGFACQFSEQDLPCEPHDMRLDGFVSERHRLRF